MEGVVSDIAAGVKDILVVHLGIEPFRIRETSRLAEDLGADSLDAVEIFMSCEERFDIEIPNHAAKNLATVGDAIRFIEAQLAEPAAQPSRPPARERVASR
jgi:acyl carrier protein